MNEKAVIKPGSKPADQGTPVGLRMPPKLLARLDAIIAKTPEPKPRRGQIIKMLVREALDARRARRKGAEKPR